MSTTIARLNADLYANTSSFEGGLGRANRAMKGAQQQWDSALSKANRSFSAFDGHVRKSISSIADLKTQLGGLATAAAGALSIQKIIQYSDMWKQTESRLSLVTKGMRDLSITQNQLFNIAQKNSAPIVETTDAYVRLMNSTTDAQKSQYDMLRVTDQLAKTLKVSGTNAAGAGIFLQQFGQAASNDFKAIGQELQTFADQNPTFYKIIRDAAMETGKSLKDLAKDGGLSFSFIADALEKSATRIDADAQKIQLTVGQALTQLDNAFLRFIGQNDLAQAGTSSLAAGISTLAENFGYLADAIGVVAVVLGARFVQSILAASMTAIQSFTRVTLTTAAMNTALTTTATRVTGMGASVSYAAVAVNGMSLAARGAAISMGLLSAASGALGTALAFLGGPIGVALLGTLAIMSQYTNAAADAQDTLNQRVSEHRQFAAEYISASAERRAAIERDTRANIANYLLELEALEKIAAALDNENFIFKGARKIGSKLGIDTTGDEVREVAKNVRAAVNDLEADLKRFDDVKAGKIGGGGSKGTGGGSKKDTYKDIVQGLKQESELISAQVKMYGMKESAIARAKEEIKIQNKLTEAGIVLNQKQAAAIQTYLDSIEKQTELQEVQAKQQKKLEDQERDREQALNQLGATFSSAFEKAIVDGEKLSDVLQGLLDDILQLVTRMTITEPLGNAIGDIIKGAGAGSTSGGGGGGFLSGLFDWLPSFDVGTNSVPRDMIAQVHKGEAIVPYSENKKGGGMDGLTVNVINNAGARVSTSSRDGANGIELDVMIDQAVAENLTTPGTRSNGALRAMQGKTLIRR